VSASFKHNQFAVRYEGRKVFHILGRGEYVPGTMNDESRDRYRSQNRSQSSQVPIQPLCAKNVRDPEPRSIVKNLWPAMSLNIGALCNVNLWGRHAMIGCGEIRALSGTGCWTTMSPTRK
jgi:hypothetical protein